MLRGISGVLVAEWDLATQRFRWKEWGWGWGGWLVPEKKNLLSCRWDARLKGEPHDRNGRTLSWLLPKQGLEGWALDSNASAPLFRLPTCHQKGGPWAGLSHAWPLPSAPPLLRLLPWEALTAYSQRAGKGIWKQNSEGNMAATAFLSPFSSKLTNS